MNIPLDRSRVGFWRRVLALLIDTALLLPVVVVCLVAEDHLGVWRDFGKLGVAAYQLTMPILVLLYFSFEIGIAASAGKLLTGLEIATSSGTEASTATLILRWTTKWSFVIVAIVLNQYLLAWLANVLSLLIFLGRFAAAGESRLTWHDSWAKTAVYRARDLKPPAAFEAVIPE